MFFEVQYFDEVHLMNDHLIGNPRDALQTALQDPNFYLEVCVRFHFESLKHICLSARAVVVAQVVAHQRMDREVPGSIHAAPLPGAGPFLSLSLSYLSHLSISSASLIRSIMKVQHNWFSLSLAGQLEAKQA